MIPPTTNNTTDTTPLFQGEPFAEFMDSGLLTHTDAIRIINSQSEIIIENLNEPKHTSRSRRQAIIYMLEQCMLLAAALPVTREKDRRRFRKIFHAVEKARRVTRNDAM